MLIVSERSWKHHYVTVLLPYTYLIFRLWAFATTPDAIRISCWRASCLSALLMLTTSSEVGGLFANGHGHKLALFYGMFFWAGVVLYVATAWSCSAENSAPGPSRRLRSTPAPARPSPTSRAIVRVRRRPRLRRNRLAAGPTRTPRSPPGRSRDRFDTTPAAR